MTDIMTDTMKINAAAFARRFSAADWAACMRDDTFERAVRHGDLAAAEVLAHALLTPSPTPRVQTSADALRLRDGDTVDGDAVTLRFRRGRAVTLPLDEWRALVARHPEPRAIVARRL